MFDATRGLIYASVNGAAPMYANTITAIDPTTGAVAWSVPAGSEPALMALSDDGSTLWVGINGAFSIRKVLLNTTPPTVGPLIALPIVSSYSGAALLDALVPVPGAAASVVAGVGGEGLSEVTILDDGVPRLNNIHNNNVPGALAEGPPGYVFGVSSLGSINLDVIGILAGGPSIAAYSGLLSFGGQPLYRGGRLYFSGGDVLDVTNIAAPTRIGAFAFSGLIAAVGANHLVMLNGPSPVSQNASGTLRILETDTFTQTASAPIPSTLFGFSSSVTGMVYAGGDAVAFIVNSSPLAPNNLVIAHAAILGLAAGGGPVGAGGQSGSGGAAGAGGGGHSGAGGAGGSGGAAGGPPLSVHELDVHGQHMVYAPSRALLYVSAGAAATVNPNTIEVVDPTTETIVSTIPLGKDPGPLALSDDGSTLWVGLTGDKAIRSVDLTTATPTVNPEHALPSTSSVYPATARALAVLPGTRTAVAASVAGTVVILDDGVPRANTGVATLSVDHVVAGPAGYLFGANTSDTGYDFTSFSVTSAGATRLADVPDLIQSNVNDFLYWSGRIYGYWGEGLDISDPTHPKRAGIFDYQGAIAGRDATHLLMMSWSSLIGTSQPQAIRVLDTTTFTSTASLPVPTTLVSGASEFLDLWYLGGDRAAFLTQDYNSGNRLFFIETPVIAQ